MHEKLGCKRIKIHLYVSITVKTKFSNNIITDLSISSLCGTLWQLVAKIRRRFSIEQSMANIANFERSLLGASFNCLAVTV